MKARIKKTGEIVNVAGVFLDDGILTIDEVEFVSENNPYDIGEKCKLLAQKKRDIEYYPIEISEVEKKAIFDIVEDFLYDNTCEYDYALFDRENEYIEMEAYDVNILINQLASGVTYAGISEELSLNVCDILTTLAGNTDKRSGLIYFSFD